MKEKKLLLASIFVLTLTLVVIFSVKVKNELQMTAEYKRQADAQDRAADLMQASKDLNKQEFKSNLHCTISRAPKITEQGWISDIDGIVVFHEGKKGKVVVSMVCEE